MFRAMAFLLGLSHFLLDSLSDECVKWQELGRWSESMMLYLRSIQMRHLAAKNAPNDGQTLSQVKLTLQLSNFSIYWVA